MMSLIKLCLFILSPLTAQTLAWWPYTSMIWSLQATHRWSWLKRGHPNHLFMEIDHSKQDNFFCWNGRHLIQALAWGIVQASNRAWWTAFDEEKVIWSNADQFCWKELVDWMDRKRAQVSPWLGQECCKQRYIFPNGCCWNLNWEKFPKETWT